MARNWWREYVTHVYTLDRIAWEEAAEAATYGYETELREYRRTHPAPKFRDYLVHLSQTNPAM